ncbi:MAG: hypothetical protein AAF371_11850 [Pseudomonadota bacterium]
MRVDRSEKRDKLSRVDWPVCAAFIGTPWPRTAEMTMLDMLYYAVAAAGLALYGALMALALS